MFFKTLLSCLLMLSTSAFAGILIEPYVGYVSVKQSGTVENYGTKGKIKNTTANGPGYGGRLGYGIANVGLALDYMTSNLDDDGADGKLTNIGAVFMASLPFIRGWVGYIFSSEYDYDNGEGFKGTEKGSGYKAGIGFTPLPLLSINLEYLSMNFTKENYEDFQNMDRNTQGVMLSLSVPIVF